MISLFLLVPQKPRGYILDEKQNISLIVIRQHDISGAIVMLIVDSSNLAGSIGLPNLLYPLLLPSCDDGIREQPKGQIYL